MRYEREAAQRYREHAKILQLIAASDDHQPTRRAILRVARGYEQLAEIFVAIDESTGQLQ